MFKNYWMVAWRNLVKNKVYSALNILGLASGMAVALLIGLWAWYQSSYDRWLPGSGEIYQAEYRMVRNGEPGTQASTSLMLAPVMKKDIPEIEYVAQSNWMDAHGLVAGDRKVYVSGGMVSEDFLKIFEYPLLRGSVGTMLTDPYSLVLTESTAKALFGKDDPMGKMVRIDNAHDMKVTGVLKDLPGNSTLQFNWLAPFAYRIATQGWVKQASTTWDNNSHQTFVRLRQGVSYAEVEPKLKQLMPRYKPDWVKIIKAEIFMHPLNDWHLISEFKNGRASGGLIDYVRMFSIIGMLVLFIACINFINLSTARSEKRAKEVGIRKTVGSRRMDLIFQFMMESLMITGLGFFVSLLLVRLVLPSFNTLTGSEIRLPFDRPVFWMVMIGYVFLTGVLAGARPALYFSGFQPVKVLKGVLTMSRATALPRKVLVVVQFSCSIALIISTVIVYKQIQHAKDRPTGLDLNRLVSTDMSEDLKRNYVALRHDLLATGMVASMTSASSPATNVWSWNGIDDWQGKLPNEVLNVASVFVSDDYFKTLGMELKAGRNFKENASDSLSVILNESAVARMRFKQPLNQVIDMEHKTMHLKVVGVVKDAMMISPFSTAPPTFFVYKPEYAGIVMYKLRPQAKTQEAIAQFGGIFNKYNPSFPYSYTFADETYSGKFQMEVLIGKLAGIFAGLAISISCLGLFGLAAYMAERRTKEIGVRKVLGASVGHLWLLLSREFIVLVLISCVIASPVAWYFLKGWLQEYEYRITIGPGVFLLSALMAVVVTVATVSFQSVRAALMNPVRSLRSE